MIGPLGLNIQMASSCPMESYGICQCHFEEDKLIIHGWFIRFSGHVLLDASRIRLKLAEWSFRHCKKNICCMFVRTNLHLYETCFKNIGVTKFPARKTDQQMTAATHTDLSHPISQKRCNGCNRILRFWHVLMVKKSCMIGKQSEGNHTLSTILWIEHMKFPKMCVPQISVLMLFFCRINHPF